MKYFKRRSRETPASAEGERSRTRKGGGYRLLRGTRALSVVFTLLATFIATNIAIFAANTYYNLDTGEVVVNEIQRVTNAIRATGGLIVGGTAVQDPTSGYELEVVDTSGNGIVALFGGRVVGSNAVANNEFVTLGQLLGSGGGDGGVLNAFTLGGNAFGQTAILGTTDAQDVQIVAGGASSPRLTLFDDDPDVVAEFHGRVRGVTAVLDDELVTLAQLNNIVAGSLTFQDNGFGFASYSSGTLSLNEIDIIGDTNLDAGTGLAFTGASLGVTGVLEDLNAIGAPASDGQIIVATGSGTFAYESGGTARASLGLTIGTDVQAYSPGLGQIAGLTDPNADRIMFWDDSANAYAYLEVTTGLSLSGTTLSVNSATEAVAGIARFATQAEVNANTDMTSVVRPGTLGNWNGSTNLTTVGTITNGTWQGTPIADAYIASATNWNAAFGWGDHELAGYLDGTTILGDISDVTLTTLAPGEILVWNGTGWVNDDVTGVSGVHDELTLAGGSENYISLDVPSQILTVAAVNLGTTNVTGTLPVSRGGTGITSYTAGYFLSASAPGTLEERSPAQVLADIGAVPIGRTITAGTGLTGGGDLSANRSIALSTASINSLALADTALQNITGLINEGANITITGAGTSGSPYVIASNIGTGGGGDPLTEYFKEGGNAFGHAAVLGTTDANSLSFVTGVGSTNRMTIGAAGGVTIASGNDFTVSGGTSSFAGDINLTGGNRTIGATGGSLNVTASGANPIRLASASTGNIEFFNNQNFIDSNGNLTIAGNFSLSGLTITNNGTLTTIASTGGDGLALDSATGVISIGGNQLVTDNGFDLTSGSIFREVHPIFGFDVPIRCSTACDGTFIAISRAIENYQFPGAYAGTTRQHNFTIHYADTLSSGSSSWRVYNTTTSSVVDTFTVPNSPTNNLDSSAAIFTTGDVTIPINGDDWVLQVSMPSGQTLQVNQVFLGAYDVIQ